MSDTEIKRYCINRAGTDMEPQALGAFCFHHEVKELIDAKNARIAELEGRTVAPLHETLAELLHSIGWTSPCDAQWTHLRDALPKIKELLAAPQGEGA